MLRATETTAPSASVAYPLPHASFASTYPVEARWGVSNPNPVLPEQAAVLVGLHQIRPSGPTAPFRVAELKECTRRIQGLMPRPAQETGDVPVARIAGEDRLGIRQSGPSQDQPFRFNPFGALHGRPLTRQRM